MRSVTLQAPGEEASLFDRLQKLGVRAVDALPRQVTIPNEELTAHGMRIQVRKRVPSSRTEVSLPKYYLRLKPALRVLCYVHEGCVVPGERPLNMILLFLS